MKILPLLVSTALTALVISACTTVEPPPTNSIIDKQENLKTEKNEARLVVPATKVTGTANNVIVKEIRTTTVNGKMIVDFTLLNDRGRRDVVNYRLRWLDPNGITVTQYDPWETIALEGHEQSVLSVTAPIPEATDFKLELKPNL